MMMTDLKVVETNVRTNSHFGSKQSHQQLLVISRRVPDNCIIHAGLVGVEVFSPNVHHVYLSTSHDGSGQRILVRSEPFN